MTLACAGRAGLDKPPGPEAAWLPAGVIDSTCAGGAVSRYEGPLPREPYMFAIVADVDARGEVTAAQVVDRWPLPGSCEDPAPWERPHLEAFFTDHELRPARRAGRPVRGAVVHVMRSGPPVETAPDRERVGVSCKLARAALVPTSVEDAESRLGDLMLWDGYRVGVLLDLDERGRVTAARIVTRTPETLDPLEEPWASTLLAWIRDDWVFEPATRDGRAVSSRAWLNVRVSTGEGASGIHAETLEETFRRNPPRPVRPEVARGRTGGDRTAGGGAGT